MTSICILVIALMPFNCKHYCPMFLSRNDDAYWYTRDYLHFIKKRFPQTMREIFSSTWNPLCKEQLIIGFDIFETV